MRLSTIAPFLLTFAFAFAQGSKLLTSDDLIKLKTAGLDAPTIVKLIETNGAALDTSPEAILTLKGAGIDDVIIRAALGGAKPAVASTASIPDATGCPSKPGAHYKSSSGWQEIDAMPMQNPRSQGVVGQLKIFGKSHRLSYEGTEAPLKIQEPKPVFCIVGAASQRAIKVIQMDVDKKSRTIETSMEGPMGLGRNDGNPKKLQPIITEKLGDGVLVTFERPLKTGEYAFSFMGLMVMPTHDFSIRLD